MNKFNPFLQSSFFILSLFTSIPLASQNISESFLQSLPQSLQQDFLGDEEVEEVNDNYNSRPDTRIQKLQSGIDDIKQQISSIESSLNKDIDDSLQFFGSAFFSSYQATFAPINHENFTSGYVIDVGDVLTINVVGNEFANPRTKSKIRVSRDGSVNIPSLGLVYVAGMPYEDALEAIKQFAKSKAPGLELFVNLDSARDMNILLIGNTANPGMYTLPGGSTVLSLLHSAGGINENGSYRSIVHKRNNSIIQEIDLYDVLINGNLLFQKPLRSGDSIIIGPSKRKVSISGGINYPAIYELTDEENLEELITLAQGYSPASSNRVIIDRATGAEEIYTKESIANAKVYNGDNVKVDLYKPQKESISTVKISGAVLKPGDYSIQRGQTLTQIIQQAGGYLDTAYPQGGSLYRKAVAEVQRENLERSYNQIIGYIASGTKSVGGIGLSSSANLKTILAELKAVKFSGRISAEFNLSKIAKDSSLDTVLAEGDVIHIPHFTSDIYVVGDVLNPGGRRYSSELTYNDYISKSGGLGKFADESRIIIVYPNGDASVVKNGFFSRANFKDISPGSTIFVPKEIGKLEGISYVATLAPIMSSLALSLASLNSID